MSVTSPSNEQGFNVCVVAYRHVDATTPFDAVTPATSASVAAGLSSFAPTGISTGSSNAMAVSVVGQNAGAVPTLSLLSAQSFVFEFTNGGNAAGSNSNAAGLADLAVASAGAVPFPTWTTDNTGNKSVFLGISFSLRHANSGRPVASRRSIARGGAPGGANSRVGTGFAVTS